MNIYRIVFSIAKDICSYKRSVKKKMISCCRTAVGVGQRALSLSAHTAGDPPLLAPGRVTSSCHILGV